MNLCDMLSPESPYVFYDSDHGFCINTEDVFNLIEQMQLTGHWIPRSVMEPKKPDGYPNCEIRRTYFLVTLKSGCVKTLAYEFDRDEWQITGSPVIAWMPLPAEYKEGREETVFEIIKQMPSAQSEETHDKRTETHACDCISRQAAIDLVEGLESARLKGEIDLLYPKVVKGLIGLPSAQPEQAVKGCRNCKYGKYNDHWKTNFCYNPNDCTEWNLWEPSAQPEVLACGSGELDVPDGWHWVPCSEELPKDDERVLATTAWGDVTIAERIYPPINDTCWFIHDGNTNATIDDVVAWRPLPKPYEERRKEE